MKSGWKRVFPQTSGLPLRGTRLDLIIMYRTGSFQDADLPRLLIRVVFLAQRASRLKKHGNLLLKKLMNFEEVHTSVKVSPVHRCHALKSGKFELWMLYTMVTRLLRDDDGSDKGCVCIWTERVLFPLRHSEYMVTRKKIEDDPFGGTCHRITARDLLNR